MSYRRYSTPATTRTIGVTVFVIGAVLLAIFGPPWTIGVSLIFGTALWLLARRKR